MALFRDLIRTVSEAEGLSEMTVTGIGQYLRDAGLISKLGRGRAAAKMTSEDAAHLLIGVNATALAKDAPEVVIAYRAITERDDVYPIVSEIADEDDVTRALFNPADPIQCLSGLIDCYVKKGDLKPVLNEQSYTVSLTFGRPVPRMQLWIGWQSDDPEQIDEPLCVLDFYNTGAKSLAAGDKRDRTTISEITLAAVGRILAE